MADLAEIEGMIAAALPGASVEVVDETGAGDHLRATVAAPQFEGLSRINQHRLVKAAVKERFENGQIHALSIKTSIPPSSSAPAPSQESDRDAPPLPRSEEAG
jgi:stress-induced morphogen